MAAHASPRPELPDRLTVSRTPGDHSSVVLILAGQLYLATTVELARHIVTLLATSPRPARQPRTW